MPMCCVYGCHNKQYKGCGNTFHRFPFSKPEIVKQWLIQIRRDKWTPGPKTVVCSIHFELTCFDKTGQNVKLHADAVPTIFPSFPKHLKKEMVFSCAVCGCTTRYDKTKPPGVTLHRFSKDPAKRALWEKELRRVNWKPTTYQAVCSLHFEESCMDRTGQTVRLREGAIPTVFPTYPRHLRKAAAKPKEGAVKLCAAHGCTSRQQTGSTVFFHNFPLNKPTLLKKWVRAMQREDWSPSKFSYLCSKHFLDKDYQVRSGASDKVLKANAVPSIFNFPPAYHNDLGVRPTQKRKCSSAVEPSPDDVMDSNEQEKQISYLQKDVTGSEMQIKHESPLDSTQTYLKILNVYTVPRETCDSTVDHMPTDGSKEYRSVEVQTEVTASSFAFRCSEMQQFPCSAQKRHMRQKIKVLQQKVRRFRQRMLSLKAMLQHFRRQTEENEETDSLVANVLAPSPSPFLIMDDDTMDELLPHQVPPMPVTIGTHDGTFQCDEVLACSLLKMLPEYHNASIVRTRDPKLLALCTVLVGVGGVYNPNDHRYDHHQSSFNESFNTLDPTKKWVTKLSTAGLIYLHYGRRVIAKLIGTKPEQAKTEIIFDKMYEHFMEEIDGSVNGIPPNDGPPRYISSTNLRSRVARLNPPWNDPEASVQAAFEMAQKLVKAELLEKVHYFCNTWWPARELVMQAIQLRQQVDSSGEIIELRTVVPWKDHLLTLEEEMKIEPLIKFVVFVDPSAQWRVQTVPVALGSLETRLSFPEKWRGLSGDRLSVVSDIPSCTFVDVSGLAAANSTRSGALTMARKTLEVANTFSDN